MVLPVSKDTYLWRSVFEFKENVVLSSGHILSLLLRYDFLVEVPPSLNVADLQVVDELMLLLIYPPILEVEEATHDLPVNLGDVFREL